MFKVAPLFESFSRIRSLEVDDKEQVEVYPMNKFHTLRSSSLDISSNNIAAMPPRFMSIERPPLQDVRSRTPRSKSISIKKNLNDDTSEFHSASMKETCDLLTWQMYNRIVVARRASNRRRRRITPQNSDVADENQEQENSKPCDSEGSTKDPVEAATSCDHDMIFVLDL